MRDENTSPRVLKIAGRVNLMLRKYPKSTTLERLPSDLIGDITVGDVVSMAQSLITQAEDRPKPKPTPTPTRK